MRIFGVIPLSSYKMNSVLLNLLCIWILNASSYSSFRFIYLKSKLKFSGVPPPPVKINHLIVVCFFSISHFAVLSVFKSLFALTDYLHGWMSVIFHLSDGGSSRPRWSLYVCSYFCSEFILAAVSFVIHYPQTSRRGRKINKIYIHI